MGITMAELARSQEAHWEADLNWKYEWQFLMFPTRMLALQRHLDSTRD